MATIRLPRNIVKIRFRMYLVLLLWSIILLGLTAGRVGYTTHLPRGDPLNHGVNFYDPSVVELLVTSILLMFATSFYAWVIYTENETRYLTRIFSEVSVLSVIWFLLIVGTGIATNIWPNLNFCIQFTACQVLQAMLAFAWLSWLLLSVLIILSLIYAIQNQAWDNHVHNWQDLNWNNKSEYDTRAQHSNFAAATRDMSPVSGHGRRDLEEQEV